MGKKIENRKQKTEENPRPASLPPNARNLQTMRVPSVFCFLLSPYFFGIGIVPSFIFFSSISRIFISMASAAEPGSMLVMV